MDFGRSRKGEDNRIRSMIDELGAFSPCQGLVTRNSRYAATLRTLQITYLSTEDWAGQMSQPVEYEEVQGIRLRLAPHVELEQQWIGQAEILEQLLACWLVVDP